MVGTGKKLYSRNFLLGRELQHLGETPTLQMKEHCNAVRAKTFGIKENSPCLSNPTFIMKNLGQ